VTLTAAGRRLLQRAPEPPTGRLLRILSSLTSSDLRTVAQALTILNDGLGVAGMESGMLFEGDGPNLPAGRGSKDTPVRRPGATTKRATTVGDPALGKRRR
jgi:hypothetical protein